MKIRNGFVSNSSSSSFILKKLPEDVTTSDQVFNFYGIGAGRNVMRCKYDSRDRRTKEITEFCKYISKRPDCHESDKDARPYGFIDRYFRTGKINEFLDYYGDGFDNGYGLDTIQDILSNPDDYFEFSIHDTFLWGPGCAFNGSYITKNGIEINCH